MPATMLLPEEILANAINPLYQTVNQYGQNQLAMEKMEEQHELEQQGAMQLLGARAGNESALAKLNNAAILNREKTIAGLTADRATTLANINNTAALARTRAAAEAYLDRLDLQDRNKQFQHFASRGIIRQPGETDEDYTARANKTIAGQANKLYAQLMDVQQQAGNLTNTESARIQGLATQEAAHQFAAQDTKYAKVAGKMSPQDYIASISDPAKRAKAQVSWDQSLEAAKQSAMKNFSPDVANNLKLLDTQAKNLEFGYNRIMNDPMSRGAADYLEFPQLNVSPDAKARALFRKGAAGTTGTPNSQTPGASPVSGAVGPDQGAVIGNPQPSSFSLPSPEEHTLEAQLADIDYQLNNAPSPTGYRRDGQTYQQLSRNIQNLQAQRGEIVKQINQIKGARVRDNINALGPIDFGVPLPGQTANGLPPALSPIQIPGTTIGAPPSYMPGANPGAALNPMAMGAGAPNYDPSAVIGAMAQAGALGPGDTDTDTEDYE